MEPNETEETGPNGGSTPDTESKDAVEHEVVPPAPTTDSEALAVEAEQIEETNNSVREEDGPQPSQDEEPDLEAEED